MIEQDVQEFTRYVTKVAIDLFMRSGRVDPVAFVGKRPSDTDADSNGNGAEIRWSVVKGEGMAGTMSPNHMSWFRMISDKIMPDAIVVIGIVVSEEVDDEKAAALQDMLISHGGHTDLVRPDPDKVKPSIVVIAQSHDGDMFVMCPIDMSDGQIKCCAAVESMTAPEGLPRLIATESAKGADN